MDFSPLIYTILTVLGFIAFFATLAIILRSRRFKGMMGEFAVNFSAKMMLNKNEYHLIKNVTLPTEDGTTQIDHIIVSKYGVFVVETKNMKGWIFGGAKQPQWTQKLYRHSSKFQNPLHQNFKHVKTLQSLLNLRDEQVHSLVVFVGDSTFKTEMPENVTQGYGYIRFIKSKKQPVFTESQVKDIIGKISAGRLAPTWKTHRAHVRHVKEIVNRKQ